MWNTVSRNECSAPEVINVVVGQASVQDAHINVVHEVAVIGHDARQGGRGVGTRPNGVPLPVVPLYAVGASHAYLPTPAIGLSHIVHLLLGAWVCKTGALVSRIRGSESIAEALHVRERILTSEKIFADGVQTSVHGVICSCV